MKVAYVSVPVDALNREDAVKLMKEMASLLSPSEWKPLFNRTACNLPEEDPQRLWKHLSQSMLFLGECDALLFSPGWNRWPGWICPVEQDAALRLGKRCFYTWRDSSGSLRLLEMGHCGGPETTREDE